MSGPAPGIYALGPQAFWVRFLRNDRRPLALTLLMLRIGADDHHATFALDDLALLANGFHGRFYLHDVNLLFKTQGAASLLGTPGDPGLGQVVGRHFHRDFVAGQNADEVRPQLTGNMCQNTVAVGLALFVEQLDLENGVGHGLPYDTFYFNDIFFRQADCLLEGFRQFAQSAS